MSFPPILRKILFGTTVAVALVSVTAFAVIWRSTPDPLPDVLVWPVSPVLLDKDGNLIHARQSSQQEWCLPIPLEEMGTWLPRVLVAVEDKRFYSHYGVDTLALARAAFLNVKKGRVVSGASTITSQLVRLSRPRARTISTKILEFFGAWKLERHLDKKQILEYYLNRAPFGGPIRGVEAASRMYFGKRAKELSLGEASLLVGLLKGPTAYRPDRNPAAALRRRQQIIAAVAKRTGFPEELTSLALEEPLPKYKPSMPGAAWHFAELAFATLPEEGGVVRSTLAMNVQSMLVDSLTEQLRGLPESVTAAGMVVENRSASVIAYVGNARFNRDAGTEWVDCATSPRSPGSTLKPFAYLAAMEEGHIIPATLLADTPIRLGGEAPRNFDRMYRGPVTAHTALAASLNTPAVRVMRSIGVRKALDALRNAGFHCLNREEADYGDSLILGAGEVTLLELARAYTALANLGEDRPLLLRRAPGRDKSANTGEARQNAPARIPGKGAVPLEKYGSSLDIEGAAKILDVGEALKEKMLWRKAKHILAISRQPLPAGLAPVEDQEEAARSGSLPPLRRLYTEGASYLIADILKDPSRLPFLTQLTQARENAPVAFKTGTSYGLRDAWTAAYSPTHTVVIWFGKSDGSGDARLMGISLAAPAAIKVISSLNRGLDRASAWYERPESVQKIRVCTLSGAAPSPFCPVTRLADYLPDAWRTVPCSMHVQRKGQMLVVWPPELEDYNRRRFSQEDLSRSVLITSPMPGARYLFTPGGRWQPIALRAEGVSYPVHWYVNGEYFGEQTREDKPLYWLPQGGKHRLSLMDVKERVGFANVDITELGADEDALPLLGAE